MSSFKKKKKNMGSIKEIRFTNIKIISFLLTN